MRIALTALLLAASSLRAQSPVAGINALKPGQVRIVATYLGPDGKVVADTTVLTIMPPPIATMTVFNASSPPRWVPTITVGKSFCAYAQAKAADGSILTGRKVTFSSSDTLVARIAASAGCSDTTVDMAKLPVISP